jgi:glycosyltransferase involved in cell wall biosynthesis
LIKTVSIVIPCYNESEVIATTRGELDRDFGGSLNFNFEFVYVCDGGRDRAVTILRELRKRDNRIREVVTTLAKLPRATSH